jgi:UDP-glucose 4-epimerase
MAERVLVTGANGFVGRAVVARLARDGLQVRAAVRRTAQPPAGVETAIVGDLSAMTDWTDALGGVDTIVHTAARVHVMNDRALDPLTEFCRVNLEGTRRLCAEAIAAGVRRLVLVSSIKVMGERTAPGRPYRATDAPAPVDPYGISKAEAEATLFEMGKESGIEIVVVRPVVVYGPGVKGNILSLLRWLELGVPLPLGAIHNARSFVALDNLADLLVRCATAPAAANQTFLVSDGEDLSTTTLLKKMAAALGRSPRLVPVPAPLLRAGLKAVGAEKVGMRLLDSLQVDITATQQRLDWSPPASVDDGLAAMVRHYRANRGA